MSDQGSSGDAQGDQEAVQASSIEGAEEEVQSGKLKSGVDARKAALARWDKQRERDAQDAARSEELSVRDDVLIVRTTVKTGAIIAQLEKDALKGNTQAARELRAWLSELPIEADTDVSDLDRRTRQRLLARLLAEIEEEHAEQEGVDSALPG